MNNKSGNIKILSLFCCILYFYDIIGTNYKIMVGIYEKEKSTY